MDQQNSIYLKRLCAGEENLSDMQIKDLQQQFDFSFPKDYIEILKSIIVGKGR